MIKVDLKNLSFHELQNELETSGIIGAQKFRVKQIYEWIHQRLSEKFDEMSNLPKEMREKLENNYRLTSLKIEERKISKIDGTEKYLFLLEDGNIIESVWMKYDHGNSVCISSQVGCRMGCRFCASAIGGKVRNLTPAEMLDQVYRIQKITGERVSNVVVMGTGEPFDNYENLVKFLKMLSEENGLHISQRNITVSTCGLAEKIREFAEEGMAVTLALSLHASSDEKRRKLMPIADKYSLKQILAACDYYFEKTGRRITFEYSLIGGVNDTEQDQKALRSLLKGKNCHLNLIPVNPIKERDYIQSEKKVMDHFRMKMEKYGINVTIRREMGRDIQGACGQLRKSHCKIEEGGRID